MHYDIVMHYDILMHDTSQVRFTQLAISGYQQILDYAASHPHHARQLEAEVIQAATRGRVYHGLTTTGDRQRGHH